MTELFMNCRFMLMILKADWSHFREDFNKENSNKYFLLDIYRMHSTVFRNDAARKNLRRELRYLRLLKSIMYEQEYTGGVK